MRPDAPPAGGRSVSAAITEAAARFAFSDTARLDSELLAAHALGLGREAMLLSGTDRMQIPSDFVGLVERRAAHEPIAYIVGTRDFWTLTLAVGPGVLVPRADSETLIEAAVDAFAGTAGPRRILDLGTGSGALLLAALDQWPAATGVGVDASAEALEWARRNVDALGMTGRATLVRGDWTGTGEGFDLILCNPPYVEADAGLPFEVAGHEPAAALFAGVDGLDAYRAIAGVLRDQIAPGGVACIEIGNRQAASVTRLLAAEGLNATPRRDLGGRDRCLVVAPRRL